MINQILIDAHELRIDDDQKTIGFIRMNDANYRSCANRACIRAIKNGMHIHALPSHHDDAYVIMDSYHFANINDAIRALIDCANSINCKLIKKN